MYRPLCLLSLIAMLAAVLAPGIPAQQAEQSGQRADRGRRSTTSSSTASYYESIGAGAVHGSLVQDNRQQDRTSRSTRTRTQPATNTAASAATSTTTRQRTQPAPRSAQTSGTQPGATQASGAEDNKPQEQAAEQDVPLNQLPPEEIARRLAANTAAQQVNSRNPPTPNVVNQPGPTAEAAPAQSLAQIAVLYLRPATVSVQEGEEFTTALVLSNPQARDFNRLTATLQYNSSAIEPVGGCPLNLAATATTTRTTRDEANGVVNCELDFQEPRNDRNAEVLEVVWRARHEIRSTPLTFLHDDPGETFVGMAGEPSILGSQAREAVGLIDTSVRVAPDPRAFLSDDPSVIRLPWADSEQANQGPQGGVTIALVPRHGMAAVGDVIDVDVVVRNAHASVVDDLGFAVQFDPSALEVVDTDNDNWIAAGVNVWDGPYHTRYPFDLHIDNEADNDLGLITYRMGFSEEIPLSSGVVATIRFRALRPANSLALVFDPEKTAVRDRGEDLLGDPRTEGDGQIAALVRVVRAPVASASRPEAPSTGTWRRGPGG
jgi:hypothetical protein